MDRESIRAAFLSRTLQVRSVNPTGQVEWQPISRIMRTPTGPRRILEIKTQTGQVALTHDHKLHQTPTDRVPADQLRPGSPILVSPDRTRTETVQVESVRTVPQEEWVYNLSVPPYRNFLCGSLVCRNSPDTFYHFRPPEHEGRVGRFDRVFGQVWQDQELLLYLRRAIDDWTLVPPMTDQVRTIDEIWSRYPGWRSGVTWGAIIHALFALQINWIQEEFNYSIGGVSLDIERSSKYQSALGDAKEMWDKAAEGKTRTTLYIMGLKQSRFGVGVRSAFGPSLGKNTLSPRAYVWGFLIPLLAAKYYTLESIFSVIWS